MSWTAPKSWIENDVLTAEDLNIYLSENMRQMAANKMTQHGSFPMVTDLHTVTERIVKHAFDPERGFREDDDYGDLVDSFGIPIMPGPSVTVEVSSQMVILWGAGNGNENEYAPGAMTPEITGPSSLSALDARALITTTSAYRQQYTHTPIGDLIPGTYTVTMKYRRVPGGVDSAAQWANRWLLVLPF